MITNVTKYKNIDLLVLEYAQSEFPFAKLIYKFIQSQTEFSTAKNDFEMGINEIRILRFVTNNFFTDVLLLCWL